MKLCKKAAQILKTLVDGGHMDDKGCTTTAFKRDNLYLLAKLTPPTNGSLELAARDSASCGLRRMFNVSVNGVMNPMTDTGAASSIFSDDVIKFEGLKDGLEFPDVSSTKIVDEISPLIQKMYEINTIASIVPQGYALTRI